MKEDSEADKDKDIKEEKVEDEDSEFDSEAIIQEKTLDDEEIYKNKPKLRSVQLAGKLTEMPKLEKGSDLSGLCSIM